MDEDILLDSITMDFTARKVVEVEQVGHCQIEHRQFTRTEQIEIDDMGPVLLTSKDLYEFSLLCHECGYRAEGPDLDEIRKIATDHPCEGETP